MIVHFNVAEMNGVIFDKKSQSLKGQKEEEASITHSRRFQKGSSSRTKFVPSSSGSKKIQKKKGGKGKSPTATTEGKGKAKIAPSTLLRRRKRKETSSFKKLKDGEMTLKFLKLKGA
ncbi:DNA-binding protein HEXBP-like [Cucumis melo var. makuwa]|uniref:DNA-binding protein HEXBP-like n=1 Tax=Cucumis melo var. makuwa TaxID=1194695 RepID=A0A5A7U3W2_CUCMM|nr:DNA-binding protein HEXBP-like [Cucumis melo var. makuwa]TYK18802.1 DNA-binding protein HEXBP-like [Cucumis melo var. makuwa]